MQISNKKYPQLKEVDDVLGGAAAWENVDSTEGMFWCRLKQLIIKSWVQIQVVEFGKICLKEAA